MYNRQMYIYKSFFFFLMDTKILIKEDSKKWSSDILLRVKNRFIWRNIILKKKQRQKLWYET